MRRRTLLAASLATTALAAAPAVAQPANQRCVLWHIFTLDVDFIHPAIRLWNERNPRTPIEPRLVPLAQLNAEVTRAVASGDVPDIVTLDNSAMANFASQGVLEDMTELVRATKVFDWSKYYPGPVSAATWRGRVYGLPRAVNTLALYYNRDAFRQAGLDPAQPPRTWSAIIAAAAKLTDRAANRFGITFCAQQTEEGTFQWLPWLQQAGGAVDRLGEAPAREALQVWVDFVKNGHASRDVLTMRQFEATSTFMAGNAAMVVGGPWELPRLQNEAKFDWAVATLPVKDDRNIRASALGEAMFAVMKGARNRELAFRVCEHFQTDEVLASAWPSGRLPPRSDVRVDATRWPEAFAVFSEQMQFARVRGPHPNWPEISRPIQIAIQEAVSGRSTAEEALRRAAAAVAPIFARTPLPT